MLRFRVFSLALIAAAVHAQGRDRSDPGDRLRELQREFRMLDVNAPGFSVQREERMRILALIARVDDPRAASYLVDVARDPRYVPLLPDVLKLLATLEDQPGVAALFKEHAVPGSPHRRVARDYLLRRAIRKRDDAWLRRAFDRGSVADRFLALRGMGRIGSVSTLECAAELARGRDWKPVPGTPISCGTIAAALKDLEGVAAARLLLVLRRDPRFTPSDEEAVSETTRLWANRDLQGYIRLEDLAAVDPVRRAETARFLGAAGIEAARAPLVHLASSRHEPEAVRAAAVEALGGLSIAKGDLARTLARFLADRERAVRVAAIDALGRLRARQAAAALVAAVGGPLDAEARAALAGLSGLPADTDWVDWLKTCQLRPGT